jgi:type VI secretion system protein ImpK
MSDNPFAEPDDNDRTQVRGAPPPRPVPSGMAPPPAAGPAPPRREPAPRFAGEAETLPKVGTSPLAAAAAPILDLLARLSTGGAASQPDPTELRERALRALRTFEADARAAEVPAEQVRAAHFALCVALDDVVLSTPWGASSVWNGRSLASTLHDQVKGGERIFDVLKGMQNEPGRYQQALEVAYLVLSLGLQGRYRMAGLAANPVIAPGARGGATELERIREALYQLLAQLRGPWERELSPRWKGVDAPHRPAKRWVPAWVALPVALATLGFGYAAVSEKLNTDTDQVFEKLAAMPPLAQPAIDRGPVVVVPPAPPPPPPAPAPAAEGAPPAGPARADIVDRFREFLRPEIQTGQVTVEGDRRRALVRIKSRGMFASGSATVDRRFVSLLQRVGEALRDEPGRVQIVGHSDNQPIRTVQFPSNFHLSTARAEAARAIIVPAEGQAPDRFFAEGRGEAEPIAPNTTPEGREENRRIEVVLLREAR